MITSKIVQSQLKQLKARVPFWLEPEVRELSKILVEGENIEQVVNGRYAGGLALLCSTNRRLILIDKKPFYLTFEDIRFEMIASVDYLHRLINATVNISTITKSLHFTSMRHSQLRALSNHVQEKVMELRQPQHYEQPATQQPIKNFVSTNLVTTAGRLARLASVPTARYRNPYTQIPLVTRERMVHLYSHR